jgi:hypothetical protein
LRSEINKRQTQATLRNELKKRQGGLRIHSPAPADSWLHVVPPSPAPSTLRELKHLPLVPNQPRPFLEIGALSREAQKSIPHPDPGFRWVLQQLPVDSVAVAEV